MSCQWSILVEFLCSWRSSVSSEHRTLYIETPTRPKYTWCHACMCVCVRVCTHIHKHTHAHTNMQFVYWLCSTNWTCKEKAWRSILYFIPFHSDLLFLTSFNVSTVLCIERFSIFYWYFLSSELKWTCLFQWEPCVCLYSETLKNVSNCAGCGLPQYCEYRTIKALGDGLRTVCSSKDLITQAETKKTYKPMFGHYEMSIHASLSGVVYK